MNLTTAVIPPVHAVPFYYSPRTRLFDDIPDYYITIAVPVIAYWGLSLFFHMLDVSGWKWLDQYRIHESEEVKKKNLVGRTHVVLAVLFQQLLQTLMGLVWLKEEIKSGTSVVIMGANDKAVGVSMEVWWGLQRWERLVGPLVEFVFSLLGKQGLDIIAPGDASGPLKDQVIAKMAYFVYWWGVPSLQFVAAIFFIDTWQYFLHRLMHTNKLLYRSFHSWHHRLYVPYAFGALYNHPVEGFLLDTLGAALAEWLTGLSARQAMLLFAVSTFKTVDDHCGYSLPFDPLQLLTSNNADYHDIHHQTVGIKSNFAQPFFVHWDALLGTRMTREEMERRKKVHSKLDSGKTE